MTNLSEFLAGIEQLWPESGAEEWDSTGLVTGRLTQPIAKVLLAVDCSSESVTEAVSKDANVLLTHHPLLLRPITTLREDRYKGNLLGTLIRSEVALIAAHTNADVVVGGVSDVLADVLGLTHRTPIVAGADATSGIGRAGNLPKTLTVGDVARILAQALPSTATGVRVAGDYAQAVSRVALCAGAGDSLLAETEVIQADVFITSDLRHHPAQEFREQALISENPTALIDISHWAAEWLWLEIAATQLREKFPNVSFEVSEVRTDPWDFTVVQ